MPSGFFCLLRFYLRVDHTMIRVQDTRFYHAAGTNFILREYSKRENKVSELSVR
jgi:type 2A phosphatase activator TIP41